MIEVKDRLDAQVLEPSLDHVAQLFVIDRHNVVPGVNECDLFFGINFFEVTSHLHACSVLELATVDSF